MFPSHIINVTLDEWCAETYLQPNYDEIREEDFKKAVEELFGVKVKQVNTSNVNGKLKRQGKTQGYTSDWKKAIVTLADDSKSIEFFDSLS